MDGYSRGQKPHKARRRMEEVTFIIGGNKYKLKRR
jgi:hypothetical protein